MTFDRLPPPPPPPEPLPHRPPTRREEWRDARAWARETTEDLTAIEHECLTVELMNTIPLFETGRQREEFFTSANRSVLKLMENNHDVA